MKRIYIIICAAMSVLSLSSCKDYIDDILSDAPDMEGKAVSFTTDLRSPRPSSRAAFADKSEMNAALGSYKAINENYDLTISMFKEGSDDVVASSKYSPTPAGDGFDSKGILSLQMGQKQMYWPDNVNEYGFKATCGTATVEADQSDWTKLIAQDALLGYAYGASYGDGADDIEAMNYHTNKDWYKLNKVRLEGVDGATTEDFQRIPLYLRHQRSWLTVILKAGNGVKREFLQEANKDNLVTTLFSHGDSKVTINKPLTTYTNIHYDADINGGEGDVQTTKYDAIVEPYDYSSNLETEICKVVVNNMKFTYYASNDSKIGTADEDMSVYNLTAGKHLTITATLSTDRIVHITALLEDWDEMTFNSICDDYGQNGDPIQIPDVATLEAFLNDPQQNKAGNTAIISAASLTLPDDWEAKDLDATLNLAGATIVTSKQFLNKVGNNSTVVNGVIQLTGETTAVPAVLCSENHGTVQQVTIATDGKAKATKGAVCDVNYGTIYNCTSYLAVQGDGSKEYVGGIAAKSMWSTNANATQPIIDKCVVNGRVGAENSETLLGVGGIVGYAEGRLSNNTFNYGITIMHQGTSENPSKNKNIVAATSTVDSKKLNSDRAYNNAWPTTMANELAGPNANTTAQYRAVLDCQEELEFLINYGVSEQKYRVAADFDVDNSWTYGQTEATGTQWTDTDPVYNHSFILDGNNHTITTHGKMLFSHINGEIMNLKVYCAESIIEEPNATSTNVIAPLAYSVNGANAKLTNVKVRMADGKYIQASQPSGLVCCAYDGAVIDGCEVEVDLRSRMKHDEDSEKAGEGNDARRYMGALAAFATNAEFVGCTVHSGTQMQEVLIGEEVKHTNLFIGGLVGGTTIKNNVDPSLLIHDCTSWCVIEEGYKFGAIIGRTKFTKNNTDTNGMREGCQGNWWSNGNPASDLGTSYEKILGKKNSVGLNQDTDDWWN